LKAPLNAAYTISSSLVSLSGSLVLGIKTFTFKGPWLTALPLPLVLIGIILRKGRRTALALASL